MICSPPARPYWRASDTDQKLPLNEGWELQNRRAERLAALSSKAAARTSITIAISGSFTIWRQFAPDLISAQRECRMSVVLDRLSRSGGHGVLIAAWLLAAASPLAAQSRNSSPAAPVVIAVDQARVMKLPDGVATLVVGNPLIADVSIQSGGMMVLTGKGHGMTNMVALDRSGTVLEQKTIQVQGARDSVVIYRGVERESYSCTPRCERRITLGDNSDYFAATLGQTAARNGQAATGVQAK
jgi:Flp pilus assembly secretin CpaC